MKELITRVEELAVQLAGAQLQIDTSEAEARELGRELGKARQRMMELVSERDHPLARVPTESWADENKRLAEQSKDLLGVIERREQLIRSLNDEITKRDHELRAHEKELAEQREEIRSIIETATYFGMTSDEGVGNFIKRKCIESEDVRDEIIRAETNLELVRRECEQIRREVPLESTREALKNAVAKLQEVTAQLDSAKGEAEEWLKQCHAARRQRDEVKAEARKETQRLSDLCAELQSKHEILLAAQNTVKADVAMVYQIADKLGRNQAESIPEFIERQALRLAALESKARPSHPSIDWQGVARNLEQTIAGLNAKVAELEAQGAYATKVASQLGERIAYVQKQSMALETLVMRIKSYRNTEAVQQCALIHQLIDATLETMGTRLTA